MKKSALYFWRRQMLQRLAIKKANSVDDKSIFVQAYKIKE